MPAVVIVMEGGYETLSAACEAIEADIPVLVFAGSGKAADFIAAAYDRREQPSVLLTVCNICVHRFLPMQNALVSSTVHKLPNY